MNWLFQTVFALHSIFGALWAGATVLFAFAVVPAAGRNLLDRQGLELVGKRFWYLTAVSIVVQLLTGGHLAGNLYTTAAARSTSRWTLVLAMVGLWLVLAILLLVGFRKLSLDDSNRSVDEIVSNAAPWFYAGGVVAVLLLVVGGLL